MLHIRKLSVAFVLFGLSNAWTAVAQTASQKPGPWLLQSVHVVGDIREGFRKTCLIVYPNGEYHRELRQQVHSDGRAQFEWEAPKVFEAKLTVDDLNALRAILETPEFSSVNSVVGDSGTLVHKLLFGPQGAVRPHENIEIVTIAVARSNAPQVFELAHIAIARKLESVKAFLDWVKSTERSQGQRLAASQATNCSPQIAPSSSVDGAPMATGVTYPKPIHAPEAQIPHDKSKNPPVAVELVINPDGSVGQVSLQSSPSPDVAQSVLEAVRKWKFQPATLLGVPIANKIQARVEFRDK